MAAIAITSALVAKPAPRHAWALAALGAVLPDVDAIGRPFGRGDLLVLGGHRALTHSLLFAAVFGLLAVMLLRRSDPTLGARLWLCFFVAVASHGALDATTSYGEGIEFLAPWSSRRFWAPWHPLGRGILRDTLAFVLCCGVARIVTRRRGLDLPRVLTPRTRRTAA